MILNRQRTVRIARPALESFLRRIRRQLRLGKAEVTIAFVTDAEIARLNRAYRKKQGPTDVLSFPAPVAQPFLAMPTSANPSRKHRATKRSTNVAAAFRGGRVSSASPLVHRFSTPPFRTFLGDIAISPATARRNAKSSGQSLNTELRILMLHGVLHLLGYDHETDTGQMERLEQKLRRQLRLA